MSVLDFLGLFILTVGLSHGAGTEQLNKTFNKRLLEFVKKLDYTNIHHAYIRHNTQYCIHES